MALLDASGTMFGGTGYGLSGYAGFESFEPRRLMAVTPLGAPAQLAGTGVVDVQSMAANTDTFNNFRYALYTTSNSAASVSPVTGNIGSFPQTAVDLTIPANSTISNLDVAANTNNDRFAVAYQVTTTTTLPAGPNGPGGTVVDSDIYVALYVNGTIVGTPTRVNTTTGGNQTDSRIAMDGTGNFVVVWQSTQGSAVVGRQFNANGTANGGEFTISSTGVEPDVAANASGVFVTVYNIGSGTDAGTYAQIYNANGTATGTPIQINTDTFSEPAVGVANNGRFVVAWATGSGAARRVVAQRYSNVGTTLGAQFSATVDQTHAQTAPQVAVDTGGGYVVGFAQASSGTVYDSAGFRLFRSNGIAADDETVVTGVKLTSDNRFGLGYRVPGLIHLAWATSAGEAIIQAYQDDSGGGTGDEVAVPTDALLIDGTGSTALIIEVGRDAVNYNVYVNGVLTTYDIDDYTSLYIRGSTENDFIRISNAITIPAIVYARAGANTVFGGSGDDSIDGGSGGTITITDEDGNETTAYVGNAIQARAGDDYVYGGADADTIFGGGGDDRLLGGPGRNLVYGENGNDTLIAGNRGDGLIGGSGNDSLRGGDGGDYLEGNNGDDTLDGGDGNDRINGGNGNDEMYGGLGADVMNGGRGSDSLYGNDGRDTLYGGQGADLLRGGGNSRSGGILVGTRLYDIVYYDLLDVVEGESTRVLTA
ncbi:MAG: calcium-binding protein [Tepidisphaeraceae bacterium]